jgi:hypothetical protein
MHLHFKIVLVIESADLNEISTITKHRPESRSFGENCKLDARFRLLLCLNVNHIFQ